MKKTIFNVPKVRCLECIHWDNATLPEGSAAGLCSVLGNAETHWGDNCIHWESFTMCIRNHDSAFQKEQAA